MPNGVSARAEDRASGWCQGRGRLRFKRAEHFVNEAFNEAFKVLALRRNTHQQPARAHPTNLLRKAPAIRTSDEKPGPRAAAVEVGHHVGDAPF